MLRAPRGQGPFYVYLCEPAAVSSVTHAFRTGSGLVEGMFHPHVDSEGLSLGTGIGDSLVLLDVAADISRHLNVSLILGNFLRKFPGKCNE